MNRMNVMIIGLLALAAFIQLARANDGSANKTPVDDEDSEHENNVNSDDDEDDDVIRPYAGQQYGILEDDERFKEYKVQFGFDGPEEEKDEYYVEEDPSKKFLVPVGKYGELLWKTDESPDRILKDKQNAKLKQMPTMDAAYEHFSPSGKHTVNLNVYEEWNKDPGNKRFGQHDLERIEKAKCGSSKTQETCFKCCGSTPGSGIIGFNTVYFTKKYICVCRDADLSA